MDILLDNSAIYLIFVNLAAFGLFALDKRRAQQGGWRISERNLLLSAVLGGSIGALSSMYLLRHKTRHWKFRIGLPLILILQLLGCWLYLFR
ncbi:MAG: DUF1294 domain-containing protein [Ignavibacteriales bacterium]